jgi:hypothetical protein
MKGKTARISLVLENIEDFYSSFDDRPNRERDLSRNLLEELMKRAREHGEGELEVEFRVRKKPNKAIVDTAKKRLAEHFSNEEKRVCGEQWLNRLNGGAYVVLGGALLVVQKRLFTTGQDTVGVLLLLAGWFALFLGVEFIIADWKLHPIQKALKKLKNAVLLFSKS